MFMILHRISLGISKDTQAFVEASIQLPFPQHILHCGVGPRELAEKYYRRAGQSGVSGEKRRKQYRHNNTRHRSGSQLRPDAPHTEAPERIFG
ncbi:hypothetical protein JTE90_008961 [Oedothorax gibbosus]|uniref:Uncharacterized protein n=1 Tax=Oedothorax gibbosus TaxID=931172 RepID=A0AAV6UXV2_9ARAC|nr:hypothetical protein JTE90_008961 [Oedothorax gibbosus]